MFPRTICLRSLLSLLIMTQTPHFHALSHGNRRTAGSTVITAIQTSLSGVDRGNEPIQAIKLNALIIFFRAKSFALLLEKIDRVFETADFSASN